MVSHDTFRYLIFCVTFYMTGKLTLMTFSIPVKRYSTGKLHFLYQPERLGFPGVSAYPSREGVVISGIARNRTSNAQTGGYPGGVCRKKSKGFPCDHTPGSGA